MNNNQHQMVAYLPLNQQPKLNDRFSDDLTIYFDDQSLVEIRTCDDSEDSVQSLRDVTSFITEHGGEVWQCTAKEVWR